MTSLRALFGRAEEARRFIAYLIVSVGALGIDMAVFLALLGGGMDAALAAASGYATGIVAHWLMSTRFVFVGRVAPEGGARHQQRLLFVFSALVGLAINYGVVRLCTDAGIDPRIGKLAAVGIGFFVTWLIREKVVFALRRSASR